MMASGKVNFGKWRGFAAKKALMRRNNPLISFKMLTWQFRASCLVGKLCKAAAVFTAQVGLRPMLERVLEDY
jgi:hypothetical protein